jgi:carbonic anhydrase
MDFRNISNGTMVAFAQKHLNGNLCDVISTAGPAKKLADREKHEAIMDDLRLAIKAHHVSHVFLLSHTDCGYYGGSQRFASPKDEIRMLSNDLRQARLTLLGTFPQLKTSLFLAIYQDSDIKIKEITA